MALPGGYYVYLKEPVPLSGGFEPGYLDRELQKVEEGFALSLPNPLPISNQPPSKLPSASSGLVLFAFADGTNWNPGAGRGFYVYDSVSGVWSKL